MPHPRPHFDRPSTTDRLFNRLFGLLIRFGLALPHDFLLEIPGRRTGRLYATPVDILTRDGRRFLVAGAARPSGCATPAPARA